MRVGSDRQIFEITKAKVSYWREDKINQNVHHLDAINHKLLSIADAISRTSFMPNRALPTGISELENEMRAILTELIANVKDFFIDIDTKLKGIVQNVPVMNPAPEVNGFRETAKPEYGKLVVLSSKVQALEVSLKRTQDNEQKLMEVISTMMDKYKIQQPTLIREDPALSCQLEKRYQRDRDYSIHENLYTGIEESRVTENPKAVLQDDSKQYIRKIYAKGQNSANTANECLGNRLQPIGLKKSLKSTSTVELRKQTQSTEDKSHRLNFMMNRLRSNADQ